MNNARSLTDIRELVRIVPRAVVTTDDLDPAFSLILNHLFEGLECLKYNGFRL